MFAVVLGIAGYGTLQSEINPESAWGCEFLFISCLRSIDRARHCYRSFIFFFFGLLIHLSSFFQQLFANLQLNL